jgi:hypothetical protein
MSASPKKTEARVEGAADRRPGRESREHGATDPRNRFAGVARGEDGERPALPACDDKAFANAEKRAAYQQNGHRHRRSAGGSEG